MNEKMSYISEQIDEPSRKYKGFISEHTAEYTLIPALTRILSGEFKHTIPIYFWATMEGSNMGFQCGLDGEVRVIAVFPRRPKVMEPHGSELVVKFNKEIIVKAQNARQFGIPVMAGVPNCTSVAALGSITECAWFQLGGNTDSPSDEHWIVHLNQGEQDRVNNSDQVKGPLSIRDIIRIVHEETHPCLWPEVVENIRMVRRENTRVDSTNRSPWGPRYKPFYLLLVD